MFLRFSTDAFASLGPHLVTAADAQVHCEPPLPRPVEERTQPPDLGVVAFILCRFHLAKEGQESLMQRDFLCPRLVAVIERFHARSMP
jgi:hypothetical protein